MSRLDTDRVLLDPDSELQDSAQAIAHAVAEPTADDEPMPLGALLLAVVIVCLCAVTVLVACDPPAVDCALKACT